MKPLLAVVLLVCLGACSTAGRGSPSTDSSAPQQATKPGVCEEVRAGIDAFNQGDFEATVAHFRTALPLAEAAAARDDARAADELVEAVRYYAELAPEAYPESSRTSPSFAKYKQITLGQCESGGQEPPSESPGTTV
ncbi:MAG: hypothetical protein ACR2FG_14220 [Marmoricola sp.]